MTSNQIAYWRNKEQERSNRAGEELTSRNIDVQQQHYERSDAEAYRHNVSDEAIRTQANTIANNRLAEDILNHRNVEAETLRSNLAREAISGQQLSLSQKQLQELMRHNLKSEDLGERSLIKDYVGIGASTVPKILQSGVPLVGTALSVAKSNPAILGLLGTGLGAYAVAKAPEIGKWTKDQLAKYMQRRKVDNSTMIQGVHMLKGDR